MKIKEILTQHHRDFTAIYECEHCEATIKGGGYDDSYFHQTVIPGMICKKCGKKADASYRPLATKFDDNVTI